MDDATGIESEPPDEAARLAVDAVAAGRGGGAPGRATVADLTDDELERGLCELAGRMAATEAAFLVLVAEMDTRGMWGKWGARSAAHWLSWRLGLRLGAARERVRVAHALAQLPAIAAAFAEGHLSYCKVRALTRVSTPASESELLELAMGTTGAQLERIVRAWRRVLVTETSASSTLSRSFRRRIESDGSVTFTIRVPAEDAPIVDAAMEAARTVVLGDDGQPIETPEETELAAEFTDDPPRVRADADALLLLAESYLATEPAGSRRGENQAVVLHADLDTILRVTSSDDSGSAAEQGPAGVRTPEGQPLVAATALRRMCETSVRVLLHDRDGHPLDLGRSARHASRRQRRLLHHRDHGRCQFPGCTQRRRLIPHHVWWWSRGGPTDIDNLILLCPSHHRAVHEVGYQVHAHGRGRFTFTRPDGRAIPDSPDLATDLPLGRPAPYVTPVPTWAGDRLHLVLLIDAMVANTVNNSGHRLGETHVGDIPGIIRQAIGWPMAQPTGHAA